MDIVDKFRRSWGARKRLFVEIQKRCQELKTTYSHVDVSWFKSHSLHQKRDCSLDGFG